MHKFVIRYLITLKFVIRYPTHTEIQIKEVIACLIFSGYLRINQMKSFINIAMEFVSIL